MLPNTTATLIISSPKGVGGAAALSGDLKLFGVSSSDAQKSGSFWGCLLKAMLFIVSFDANNDTGALPPQGVL